MDTSPSSNGTITSFSMSASLLDTPFSRAKSLLSLLPFPSFCFRIHFFPPELPILQNQILALPLCLHILLCRILVFLLHLFVFWKRGLVFVHERNIFVVDFL
ncbi:hypothetical protein NP493_317g01013 [Ridgeia piscesae]|uniref:Uncharacterized protein n=1 Tax=Ridgeia piscesae TaxID=27915 RepID=A0AAD9NVZ6_RIDPI|nr:hypothetical protein NP493_317g01013 [Ridgeia piscesae]